MSNTLPELARELALQLDSRLVCDKVWLDSTTEWVIKEIKADTRGGTRREWEDVRGTMEG